MLDLPYEGKVLSMVALLPKKPASLSDIENKLSIKNLDTWLSRISYQDVDVYLPKFKVTWGTFKLNQPLHALGMRMAFGSGADFSGMNKAKRIRFEAPSG